jgi:glucan 1,3-beta-glucosidase
MCSRNRWHHSRSVCIGDYWAVRAVVYLPEGVYIVSRPIQLYLGAVLMGNPLSPPTIKAASGFNGVTLVYGKDPNQGSTTNFYIVIKNLVFDLNNINQDTTFTLLD